VIILPHPHYNALIWRIRRLEHCESIRRNEQQPQPKSDDRCPISFHNPTVLTTPDIATARVRDFTLPREKGSALPLLADAQSDAVGSKTSRAYKRISNEALHIPRERDKKISPTRNSAGVRNTVTLTHENDRVSERIPLTHPGGLFHSLGYRD
jgi:hypothetical protein